MPAEPFAGRETPESAPPITGRSASDEASHGTEIDLTGALHGLKENEKPAPAWQSLTQVFKDLRAQVGGGSAEEAAEQLKLARTYLDTGMATEAIDALRSAARSPRHRFEAASSLARLYRQRNEPGPAVEWFERAAEAPAPTAEDGRALLYDLGVTLEALGETARALAVFLELQSDAGRYRDVQARVDRLSRVQTGG